MNNDTCNVEKHTANIIGVRPVLSSAHQGIEHQSRIRLTLQWPHNCWLNSSCVSRSCFTEIWENGVVIPSVWLTESELIAEER